MTDAEPTDSGSEAEPSAPKPQPTTEVSAAEVISRYCLSSSSGQISTTKAKYGLFLPNQKGATSVYRINGLRDDEIWQIGRDYVAAPRGGSLIARADVAVSVVNGAGLRVDPQPAPHPRHADIVDWPEGRDDKVQRAQDIAKAASLKRC